MEQKRVDVAVLGGGPGGYPAAIRLGQAGRSVALIEAQEVGGTCLNRGCIPTKALVSCMDFYNDIKHAEKFGIHIEKATINWPAMVANKDEVVAKLVSGLNGLIRSNGVEVIKGRGKLVSPKEIEVSGDAPCRIIADNIVIATGSECKDLSILPVDAKQIHSSTTLLQLQELPESLAIVGAGAIGVEFASIFATFGVKVSIIELLPRILPLECETVSWAVAQALQQDGVEMYCGEQVDEAQVGAKGVALRLKSGKIIHSSIVLSAVGRSLNSSNIGLEEIGCHIEKGAIKTNDKLQTNVDGIWVIGDVNARAMYAHSATHQGLVVAKNILGEETFYHDPVPRAIFTKISVGSVGYSLAEAKERGYRAKLGSFPLQALGKAQAAYHSEGFSQIVIEEGTGRILGAQIVGQHAGDLIAELIVAITNELTIECITESIHIHPTFSESILEAAYIVQDQPLHFPRQMLHTVQKE